MILIHVHRGSYMNAHVLLNLCTNQGEGSAEGVAKLVEH